MTGSNSPGQGIIVARKRPHLIRGKRNEKKVQVEKVERGKRWEKVERGGRRRQGSQRRQGSEGLRNGGKQLRAKMDHDKHLSIINLSNGAIYMIGVNPLSLSLSLSVCLSVCLSINLPTYLYTYLPS